MNVSWILKARGWKQKDLAERAKISNSFLSDIINDNANPSLRIMLAISKALRVPLVELLNPNLKRFSVFEKESEKIPEGFEKITVILPKFRAFEVKKMAERYAKKSLDELEQN